MIWVFARNTSDRRDLDLLLGIQMTGMVWVFARNTSDRHDLGLC